MNPININQLYNEKKNKQTKNKKQKPTNKENHDNILMNWTYHDDHTWPSYFWLATMISLF